MAFIYFFSSIPHLKSGLPNIYDLILRKIAHITEYFILFFLWFRALDKDRKKIVWATIFSLAYAFLDEYHQTFILDRQGCFRDVGIDSLGILIGYLLSSKDLTTIFQKRSKL